MAEKVSYAIIEMVDMEARLRHRDIIDSTIEIERGLFKGILLRDGNEDGDIERFVMLKASDGKITVLNLRNYNIVVLEVMRGPSKEIIFYRAVVDDQKAAFNHVADLLAELQEQKLVMSEEIVDTSKFVDVPKDLADTNIQTIRSGSVQRNPNAAKVPGAGNNYGGGIGAAGNGNNIYGRNWPDQDWQNKRREWVAEKDRKPEAFKRDSNKPSKYTLLKMRKMVSTIANGEYEDPPLPKCSGEDAIIEEPSDDDKNPYTQMGWE